MIFYPTFVPFPLFKIFYIDEYYINFENTIKTSNQRIKESKNQRIKESKNQRTPRGPPKKSGRKIKFSIKKN